ncbi:hypothetical protein GDO78_008718 [Eleutherodactylus coqui]|uniref:J domain-containing protein n=1 Tax=Eleutherodactylus coqui TaxID=57060 RepID=A0A8J6FFF2_ELECQ|nr:hypothetical protein GDO78_008718 [Eleutherodactylus coqui]
MAEVSLRLLRLKTRQHLIEEKLSCGRKHGGSLLPLCVLVSDPKGVVAPESSNRMRLYSMWPSGTHRGQTLDMQMQSRLEVRFYSQWTGSRSSYHQNGNRRKGANGSEDKESPLYRSRTAYYDIMGVTPNATQAQVKTAYYKQTFRFHPDRNHGNEDAARQFGLVTEAYHVLGSVSLRKKYDRGILSLEDVRSAKKPTGKSGSPPRKEASGPREASTSSTTPAKPMFDFDAFYQAHYGEQLAREQAWKARREYIKQMKEEKKKANITIDPSPLIIFVSVVVLYMALR